MQPAVPARGCVRNIPDSRDTPDVAGTCITIRTMQPADRDIEQRFMTGLSPQSRYHRFHSPLKALDPAMLDHFTHVNYPENMALVASFPVGTGEREIGVARYAWNAGADRARA